MEQLMLGEFKGNGKKQDDGWAKFRDDEFEGLSFESKIIKQFDLQENKIFKFSERLGCKRGLDKKNKLVFKVLMEVKYPDSDWEWERVFTSKDRKEAIEFFYNIKDRCEWEQELNEENKIWDGRRYVLKIKGNKVVGKDI